MSDNPLKELVENLEKLVKTKRNQQQKDIIISKISRDYFSCENFFGNHMKLNQTVLDNKLIEQYLKIVDKNMNKCEPQDYIYFNSTKNLLEKIKMHNLNIIKKHNLNFIEQDSLNNNINNIKDKNSVLLDKQLEKQKIIQAQELSLLNDNQGRALSALECYSNRFTNSPTNYFDYYNMNNLANKKNNNQLRGQCIVQTQLFRMSYLDYIKKYGSYKIDNMDINNLTSIINKWMGNVEPDDKIIYKDILDIICSINCNSESNSFKSYSKNCQNATMNPQDIASMAPGIYNYNHQRSKQAKHNYIETGKMESKLNIGKSYKDDKEAQILIDQIKSNQDYYKYEYPIEQSGNNK